MSKIRPARNGTKQETITKKAATLFRKKGFSASSMRELAENIGVEAPSLYNHIGSKNELLTAICFKLAGLYNDHLSVVESKDGSTVDKLIEIIRFHIRIMLESYDEVYVLNHEWKQMKEPHLAEFISQRRAYEGGLLQLIEKGIRKKEFRSIHPYVAMLTILSAVRGIEIWHRHRNNIPADTLEKHMIEHLLNGLIK